jgi:hypothetical protein
MEGLMESVELVGALRKRLDPINEPTQTMQRRDDVGFQIVVAILHRESQRLTFDNRADANDVS